MHLLNGNRTERTTAMRLIWFHKWIVRIARRLGAYGTLDTEAALREKNRKIIELEQALAERPIVYIQTATPIAVNAPLQTTGPIQVLGARQRSFRRQLNTAPRGTLMKHDIEMRVKKQTTGTLGPETVTGLQVVKPPHKVELRASDDDFLL
jgi:hypothetical protein